MVLAEMHRLGAVALPNGSVCWRLWAPRASRVDLILMDGDRRRSCRMQQEEHDEHGCFHHTEAGASEGQRYVYSLDGGPERADPCSRWQPEGIPGPSAVFRPERFGWSDGNWKGIGREDLVFYEVHVGTFTREGTFEAIIPRLVSLRELGITAVELMPVGQFPGTRNWGYDGVLPYAAQNSYGGPRGLQRLVDACHAAGLAIFLDVVYNHLGPEGNYLSDFGPYFADRYKTPWGQAINYDSAGCDGVREFVLDNVRMWLEEFHLDGLRLDAVHAIYDLGARHILREVKEIANAVSERVGRVIHIIAESDLNDPRLLLPPERGGYGLDGQWSDDFHHAVHAYLTRENRGYYLDFGEAAQLAKVLESPFLYAGNYSRYRGRKQGAPAGELPGDRFVVCLQNHDQVGNRARGDRLSTILGCPAQERLAASLLLLSPHLPLLFMGEEYGETNPFPFFCSFCGEALIQAVREGRASEFADFMWRGEDVPDPQAEATFESARLTWSWPEGTVHGGLRRLHQDLLTARREWPAMRDFSRRSARLLPNEQTGSILQLIRGGKSPEAGKTVQIYFNLTGASHRLPEGVADTGSLLFSSEAKRYMGRREGSGDLQELMPFECLAFGPATWRKFL